MNQYSIPVSQLDVGLRQSFIRKVYLHLLLAVLAFTGIEVFLFQSGAVEIIANLFFKTNWLIILGIFMLVATLMTKGANSSSSKKIQYLCLFGYILLEAIIFAPLLLMAHHKAGGGVIESAVSATLLGFGGLTLIGFGTKADLSWLKKYLIWFGLGAIILIVCGTLFGFNLGVYFTVAMILYSGCTILYTTSNIIHQYDERSYVSASLQLFASIALMFWYILSFFSRD